jgi:hypothetical protein
MGPACKGAVLALLRSTRVSRRGPNRSHGTCRSDPDTCPSSGHAPSAPRSCPARSAAHGVRPAPGRCTTSRPCAKVRFERSSLATPADPSVCSIACEPAARSPSVPIPSRAGWLPPPRHSWDVHHSSMPSDPNATPPNIMMASLHENRRRLSATSLLSSTRKTRALPCTFRSTSRSTPRTRFAVSHACGNKCPGTSPTEGYGSSPPASSSRTYASAGTSEPANEPPAALDRQRPTDPFPVGSITALTSRQRSPTSTCHRGGR